MREELFEHCGKFARVEEQLREGAHLCERLDIALQVRRVNQSGLGGEYKGLELLVEGFPIENEIFHWSEVVLAPVSMY